MGLPSRYQLHQASFLDVHGDRWAVRCPGTHQEALALIAHVLGHDLQVEPENLDQDRIHNMLSVLLPGRLTGKESYATDLPDLLEEFLLHLAEQEGLSRQWDWTHAVTESRSAYEASLNDPDRERLEHSRHFTPDRRPGRKLGRNDPCPCGSGKKYKLCCLRT